MGKKERDFQSGLIKEIKTLMPDCMVLKNDSGYIQGIPDLLILKDNKWVALECKISEKASCRPNQEYYIDKLGSMSYASFIYPENKEEILNEVQSALQP